jgi:transposase-like protein
MTRSRRTFTAQEKLTAVRRYSVDKVPVSDRCDELGFRTQRFLSPQSAL